MTVPGQADAGPGQPVPDDLPHLRRCVELAAEAVDAGDFPFGSVLVAGDGRVLAEDRNRENPGRLDPAPGIRAGPLGGGEYGRRAAGRGHRVHLG